MTTTPRSIASPYLQSLSLKVAPTSSIPTILGLPKMPQQGELSPHHAHETALIFLRGYPTTTPSISRWTPPTARPTQPVTEPSGKEDEGSGLWPYVRMGLGVVGGCVALGVTVAVTKRGVRRWDADGRPQITWKPREWPSITRPGSRYISGHSYSGPPEGDGDGTEGHELPEVAAPPYCAVSTHAEGCNQFRSGE